MHIMIAGPYTSGSADKQVWKQNHQLLNQYAFEVFQKGHIPVIGVNAALPIIEEKGWEYFEKIMMPISLALAERCDAVLRIGGPSKGADQEVEVFRKSGLPIFQSLEDIPQNHE